jgi:hypothetical protein
MYEKKNYLKKQQKNRGNKNHMINNKNDFEHNYY